MIAGLSGAATGNAAHRPVTADTAAAAGALVDERIEEARGLGRILAELIDDPAAFAATAARGMDRLRDPLFGAAHASVVPGSAAVAGVRAPLQRAVWGAFSRRTRRSRPSSLLLAADALLRNGMTELRIFGITLLARVLPTDPERAWQLLRTTARGAPDSVTVDTLARSYAIGILGEPYRWAELEQLVYSPSRWERRLVGSTIATLPVVDPVAGRRPEIATSGLALIREAIGDAEPDVRRSLSWALRSLLRVDAARVVDLCRSEAEIAATTNDGHRAWVLRDVLPKLDERDAAALRLRLAAVRGRLGAPATSRASEIARAFSLVTDPARHSEPPLR